MCPFSFCPMVRRSAASAALLLVGSLLLSGIPSRAFAVGETVTIEQASRTGLVGSWTLTLPNGQKVRSGDALVNAKSHTITNALVGAYTLTFEPPTGALTTVSIYTGGQKSSSGTDPSVTFAVKTDEALRITADYRFQGTISIQSIPTGASYRITTPGGTALSGTTPGQYADLPPGLYTAFFLERAGCTLPRPQSRWLEADRAIAFFHTYDCAGGMTSSAASSRSSSRSSVRSSSSSSSAQAAARVRIDHVIAQAEALPGGNANVTVRVRNTSSMTLRNVTVSEMFDASEVSIADPIPGNGTRGSGRITWTIPELAPNAVWTVTLNANIDQSAESGDTILLTATVRGTDLDRAAGKNASIVVVTGLPETGVPGDVVAVLVICVFAGFLTKKNYEVRSKK